MFEISKLINHVIGGDRNRKLKVVAKLGFENDLFNGCRRLDNLVNTGECTEYLRNKLPEALGLDPELVSKAFKDTKRDLEERKQKILEQREKYERKTFLPHLWVEHSMDEPIDLLTVSKLGIEQWKLIELDEDIKEQSWEDQVATVQKAILKHQWSQISKDDMFGEITGYVYYQNYDDTFLFDVDGQLFEDNLVCMRLLKHNINLLNHSAKLGYKMAYGMRKAG